MEYLIKYKYKIYHPQTQLSGNCGDWKPVTSGPMEIW